MQNNGRWANTTQCRQSSLAPSSGYLKETMNKFNSAISEQQMVSPNTLFLIQVCLNDTLLYQHVTLATSDHCGMFLGGLVVCHGLATSCVCVLIVLIDQIICTMQCLQIL